MVQLSKELRKVLTENNLRVLHIDLGIDKQQAFIYATTLNDGVMIPNGFEVLNINFREKLIHLCYVLTDEQRNSEEIENYCHALNSDAI